MNGRKGTGEFDLLPWREYARDYDNIRTNRGGRMR